MNHEDPAVTREDEWIIENTLGGVLAGASAVSITYNSAGGTPTGSDYGTTGRMTLTGGTSYTIDVWRGEETESQPQSPDVGTRKYIILKTDLPVDPKQGDWIDDGSLEYSVDVSEDGIVLTNPIYYLISATSRGPS